MEVEALDPLGECLEFARRHTEARAWSTGIIEVSLYSRIFGIDT